MKLKINSDVYNISKRILDIDKDYYIVYNTSTKKYEVHCSSQKDTTYCVTVPYSTLDERTLNYVYQTSSKNIDKILSKIESDNISQENAQIDGVLSQFTDSLKNL